MLLEGTKYTFKKSNVDIAPESAGVYALYDDTELIYIGKADKSIRTRLQRHLRGDEGSCTQHAKAYQREACDDPAECEARLLNEYEREHGVLPRCNDVLPGV